MTSIVNLNININSFLLTGGLVIGILLCLFGYKFQKLALALVGLAVGFTVGNFLVSVFSLTGGLATVVKFGLPLVFGALGVTLFESLLAIIIGIEVFIMISALIDINILNYIIGAVCGVIAAFIVRKFYKVGIALFTSLAGSYLITNYLIGYLDYGYLLIFGVIAVVSFIFQCISNKVI